MNTAQQLLPQAFAQHQAGNIDTAESLYRTILEEDGNNPQVLSMLGMLRMQRGDWEEGMHLLNATLAIDPNQPDTLSNLGYALQNLQRYEEALECYDKAIALYPDHVSAHFNRGSTLLALGRHADAVASFSKALVLRPSHVSTCISLGNAYTRLEQHDAALTHYLKALNLQPGDPGILNNIGLALRNLKRYQQALPYFKQAVTSQPGYADAHFNMGITLEELGLSQEALASYDQAIKLQPERAESHSKRGQILQSLGRHDEAQASYQKAIALDPEGTIARVKLGTLFMEIGNNKEAINCFLDAISRDPDQISAYFNLATLNYFAGDEAMFEQLLALHARRNAFPSRNRIPVDFAMGETLEKMSRYDEAFEAYAEGNRLHFTDNPFNESGEDELLNNTIALFTRELFEQCQEIAGSLPLHPDDRVPVFIVGMPRSGTTLTEQILASHPAVFGAGELEAINEASRKAHAAMQRSTGMKASLQHLREIGQDYADSTWKLAPDAHCITDKMPGNFRSLGLIHLMLPNARIIHAMRDPMDNCFSCFATDFNQGHHYSYDLATLGRYYRRYHRMMQHWREVLPPGRILDVRYEDMVAEPEREARRLVDFLGLPWDPACLRFYETKRAVATASVNQVRQPIYTSSVARWKRFEKHLGPLQEIVGSL